MSFHFLKDRQPPLVETQLEVQKWLLNNMSPLIKHNYEQNICKLINIKQLLLGFSAQ